MKRTRQLSIRSPLGGGLIALTTVPTPGRSDDLRLPETSLSERERIVHAMNRLGYGPRPGEVERIRRIGLATYLERQLHPERVADPEIERRLGAFRTLKLSQVELFAAYPSPTMLRGIVERAGRLGLDPDELRRRFPELGEMDVQPTGKEAAPAPRGFDGPRLIGAELGQAKLIRAIYSERQLEQVMVDFWFNHFNVFIGKGPVRWMTTSYERDAIRPHALGRFRDLLGAVARHPAMLFYLDNWKSSYEHAAVDGATLLGHEARVADELDLPPGGLATLILRERGMDTTALERRIKKSAAWQRYRGGGNRNRRKSKLWKGFGGPPRGLNENYARELLELHTLGVDGGYTQQDVIDVARCFSGWTLTQKFGGYQFMFVPELHDGRERTVLGEEIGGGGIRQGRKVLDLLARRPATARFISTKLATRFVGDDPAPALIDRLSGVFLESDGDIREVLRTLITSEEFWSDRVARDKLKTPLEFVASAVRATEGEVAELPVAGRGGRDATMDNDAMGSGKPPGLQYYLNRLGQPLYSAQPPTGYDDTAQSWISSDALLNRMKFALGLVGNRVPGVEVPPLPVAGVVDLGQRLLGRNPMPSTVTAIERQLELTPETLARLGLNPRLAESEKHLARLTTSWLLASAEFQRR